MLLCIDDNHGVAHCSYYFLGLSSSDCHVCNKIRRLTHLELLGVVTHSLVLNTGWVCIRFGIEVNQLCEWFLVSHIHNPSSIRSSSGYKHNSITIEVST